MTALKWGSETQVNTNTAGNQIDPSITWLPDGGFVIVWTDNDATGGDGSQSSIKMQRFDALGQKIGGESVVNTVTAAVQHQPAIATLADGSYVVVWTDWSESDVNGARTMFRRYGADGTPLDATERLAVDIGNGNVTPAVAALANGGFAITTAYPSVGEIYLHLFDANGDLTDNHAPVIEGNFSENPHVAVSTSGTLAVAYADRVTNEIKLYMQGGDVGAGSVTETVTFFAAEDNNNPHVLALANGGFVVMWTDSSARFPDTSGTAIRAHFYTNAGQPFGGDFVVNHYTDNNQRFPVMTALADGGFAVFYESGYLEEVRGQLFNPDGTRRGVEFMVNTYTFDEQEAPAVTLLADGRIVVTWSSELGNGDGDTSSASIQMQIIDPRGGIVTGTSEANTLYGHDGQADEINGLAGNDILWGLGGNDTIYGGEGNDFAYGGKGDDIIYGGTGSDNLRGLNGEDMIFGEAGNDILRGGRGDDELFGGGGSDTLIGGEGADILNGGTGNDTASYLDSTSGVTVSLDGSLTATGDAAGDVFISIENLIGSNSSDVLKGNGGANTIEGRNGDDVIDGGGGIDRIIGGRGADTLTGGIGNDIFVYNALNQAGDVITDFSSTGAGNNDRFEFLGTAFGNLAAGGLLASQFQNNGTSAAANADVRFIYNVNTQQLFFDSDGNGGSAAVLLATLQPGATMNLADFLIV